MGSARTIVDRAYEAFGRGDVPAILNLIADEVDWDQDWIAPRGD